MIKNCSLKKETSTIPNMFLSCSCGCKCDPQAAEQAGHQSCQKSVASASAKAIGSSAQS